LELGGWNELGAWSLERLEPDPRRTQVSIFLCVARKEEQEEGDGIAFFFFFVLWNSYSTAVSLHGVERL